MPLLRQLLEMRLSQSESTPTTSGTVDRLHAEQRGVRSSAGSARAAIPLECAVHSTCRCPTVLARLWDRLLPVVCGLGSSSERQNSRRGVEAVAAGLQYSLALKNDGTVWAWGTNELGQLGDGTTTNRTAPVQVSDLSGVTAIVAGTGHALALKNDGTV
jgi:Regulator of chromosome condensation (RCC1) repeat